MRLEPGGAWSTAPGTAEFGGKRGVGGKGFGAGRPVADVQLPFGERALDKLITDVLAHWLQWDGFKPHPPQLRPLPTDELLARVRSASDCQSILSRATTGAQ